LCGDLVRARSADDRGKKLAELFHEALQESVAFDAYSQPFVPDDRKPKETPNPCTDAMQNSPNMEWRFSHGDGSEYRFRYLNREIFYRRAEHRNSDWYDGRVDCIALSEPLDRPVLCEMKYESDETAFYGFIQLLTYLSEIATENQLRRSLKWELFGSWTGKSKAHDLVIVLANPTLDKAKGDLLKSCGDLADGFSRTLRKSFPESASVLGNIACLSCRIDKDQRALVGNLKEEWFIPG